METGMATSPDLRSSWKDFKNRILFPPVCVIDKCVEALVEPLPEDNSRSGLIEGHHAAGDQHVEGHLRAKSSVSTS